MSILKREKQAFADWGITGNPFRPEGPLSDPQQLTQIFHGREREIEIALPVLYDGRNVMVRGNWGIGKTALIYTLLNRLAIEVNDLDEQILVLHIDGSPVETPTDFYRILLLAINTNPYPLLATWLEHAQDHFSRLVIAVDDLDKKDTPVVQKILEGNLNLFRTGERRAFLMTGRGFTDLQEATLTSLGIFAEDLSLAAMSSEDLRQIAIKSLNTVRAASRDDPHPFSEEVMNCITDYAQGNPRQLNTICDKVLRRAAIEQVPSLDAEHFEPIWRQVQNDMARQLSPQFRRLLYVAYRANGISEDITNEQLDQLNALTFSELIPLLKTLEEKALLLRQEDEQGFRFLPSKLFLPDDNAES